MEFVPWSGASAAAKESLNPTLGLRTFDEVSKDERSRIWKYIQDFLFVPTPVNAPRNSHYMHTDLSGGLIFHFPEEINRDRVSFAVQKMCYLYPERNFTPLYLHDKTHYSACIDFRNIFITGPGDGVLELFSYFCEKLLKDRIARLAQRSDFSDDESHHEKIKDLGWEEYDAFANVVNHALLGFRVNATITRSGIIPRQDPIIEKEIHEPVLKFLSSPKWKPVNDELIGSFKEYQRNTQEGYSTCVTKIISAIQAFLQIRVHGDIQKSAISDLITIAQNRKLIPFDDFSKDVFDSLEKVFAKIRKDASDSHPKKYYATESNARLVINLAMVFLQHCITFK